MRANNPHYNNMITKTIKLSENEYTNFTNEFTEHDVICLTGARGAGKSYPVAKFVSKMLEDDEQAKFVYMRITDAELHTFSSWCSDLNLKKISGADKYKLQRGKPTKGDILLTGYNEDDDLISERIIGKCISLESSHLYKSGKYDDFNIIVFEEYTRVGMNNNNEKRYVFNFLENVISVFRDRDKKIFLLCNSLKTIPLLERSIKELKGNIFKNPIKIKIFRKNKENKTNNFLAYLNGEIYEDKDFKINLKEFYIIYSNKLFVIHQHRIYDHIFYVSNNSNNKKILYNIPQYLNLKYFCKRSHSNEFYFQNKGVEVLFVDKYSSLLSEITLFLSEKASQIMMQY